MTHNSTESLSSSGTFFNLILVLAPRFNLQSEKTPLNATTLNMINLTFLFLTFLPGFILHIFIFPRQRLNKNTTRRSRIVCPVHILSIGRRAESFLQPIGSVQSCAAADMPCKQITHACLVLGVELTVHGSREALEPGAWSQWLSLRENFRGTNRSLCINRGGSQNN